MSKVIRLKKGLDIKMNGEPVKAIEQAIRASFYALKPNDFRALTPRLIIKEGDRVKAGDPLFTDKLYPEVAFTAPVSGTISGIVRGERRRLLGVVIKADDEIEYKDFGAADVNLLDRNEIVARLLQSGMWPMIRQRPYEVVANPQVTPKAVFVSAFDSAPLSPDYDFILKGQEKDLQTGIDCLKRICNVDVHLGLKANPPAGSIFIKLKNVQFHYFEGPHPAGNVGVQIHHISPISKGEYMWTVNIQDVVLIGRFFNTGYFDARKTIALTGSEVQKPLYCRTILGASIASIIDHRLKNRVEQRVISGNVLTGEKVEESGFLGFFANQVTVIPEGNQYEFLGWAMPGLNKFSATRLFPSFLFPQKRYTLDANYHGEERAFVMTGQYEKVFPMDIYPVFLLKAALAKDIERLEQLGIYEVVPEDMALCEFVCTSKTPVQNILNQAIELMMEEVG